MSTVAATGLALLLYALPLLALGLVAWRPGSAIPVTAGIAMFVAAIAFFQTGVLQRGKLASTEVTGLLAADPLAGRCEEVFRVLTENRVLLAQPTAEELVVTGPVWDQMPPEIQEAVMVCARDSFGGGSGELPEVIRR